jgi:HEAT repeat protein
MGIPDFENYRINRRQYLSLLSGLAICLAGCGKSKPELKSVSGQPLSHWLEVLKGGDLSQRNRAVDALGNVGAADPAVMPALIEALDDRSPEVRAKAALALLKSGPAAHSAVAALTKATRDPVAHVRQSAQQALDKIAGDSGDRE